MRLAAAAAIFAAAPLAACAAQDAAPPSESRSSPAVTTIDAAALADLSGEGDPILIDVRTPEEFAEGHLPGAINLPVESFDPAAVPMEEGRETILYCRSGRRSERAATMLADHVGEMVRHLDGGILAWQDAGGAVETD